MEIKRDKYMQSLIDSIGNGLIKVITGIRRSGKSYLLLNLFKAYLLDNKQADDAHIISSIAFDRREPYHGEYHL